MTPEERRLREELIKYAIDLNRSGLSTGKSGNISVGYQREMLITPSGLEYQQLAAEDIVKLDFSGQKKCSSPYPPSSEWHFHADIYQTTPSIHAIVHTHSTYCTALACTSRNIPPLSLYGRRCRR